MEIIPLLARENATGKERNSKLWMQFLQLIEILRNKNLPEEMIGFVNDQIQELNEYPCGTIDFYKLVKKKQTLILRKLEKDLKMVPKNYYMNMWLALGIGAFGMPIGIALGSSLGNMGFLGLGLPFGVAIGIALGSSLDKKAKTDGKQLDIEVKY
jgi:hypothetical protein